jgi:hypothetical protein
MGLVAKERTSAPCSTGSIFRYVPRYRGQDIVYSHLLEEHTVSGNEGMIRHV